MTLKKNYSGSSGRKISAAIFEDSNFNYNISVAVFPSLIFLLIILQFHQLHHYFIELAELCLFKIVYQTSEMADCFNFEVGKQDVRHPRHKPAAHLVSAAEDQVTFKIDGLPNLNDYIHSVALPAARGPSDK